MTIAQLRQFPEFEHISDDKALEIIANLQGFSELMYGIWREQDKSTTKQRKAA